MARLALSVLCSLVLIGQSGALPALAANSQPELKFKIYSPAGSAADQGSSVAPSEEKSDDGGFWTDAPPSQPSQPAVDKSAESKPATDSSNATTKEAASDTQAGSTAASTQADTTSTATAEEAEKPVSETKEALKAETATEDTPQAASDASTGTNANSPGGKVLQGYIRVVPTGTKIPIIMDTAVDSDTSQEGDEFSARTAEDLNIDGSTVVPAGSVIKGRIAALNAPRALMRGGSVALKFDTVTTPDNRQIPLVANIVARGGVVHARRGLKDIAIDTGTVALPTALGVGIGALAGNSATSVGTAGGALIGAGIGLAIGAIILCAKKGKKVDVRPGDELKIELAEDLRMPM